jgi:hypothetical protein
MELIVGAGLIVVSLLAFYIAWPRGGQVVRFLRNDHAQSYFVVLVLSSLAIGIVSAISGLTELEAFGGFK